MIIRKINEIFLNLKIFDAKYVYIYCDLRNLLVYFEKNPEVGAKQFLNLFKKKGVTCITPAFSYTSKGQFDLKKTKSRVGFLSNYILKRERFVRSKNPIFSYVSIGKNKNLLNKLGKSAFGKDSLHEKLYKEKCYFLHLNRPLKDGNTLIHHIEQINKANYRFEKIFKTKIYYKNKYLGNNYKAFVRKNLKSEYTDSTFHKAYKKIKKKKYFLRKKVGKIELLIYPYDNFYKDLDKLIKKDPNIFINGNF